MEELTKRGHEVVAAAGSSIRALGGGFYAAGKLDEFAEWALGLSRRDVLRLVDVSVAGPGLARAERVMRTIRELVRGRPAPDSPRSSARRVVAGQTPGAREVPRPSPRAPARTRVHAS